jgi:hypothetical protein
MRPKLTLAGLLLLPSVAWAEQRPFPRPQPRTDFTAYTRFGVEGDLSGEPGHERERFAAVPGVSFDWDHWELYVGVG